MSAPIRVVIADDYAIFRQGLRLVLEADPQLSVVGEAADGDEALRLITSEQPDVAVLDVTMPGLNGFEVAQAVRDAGVPAAIVFLTMHQDEHYRRAAFEAGAKAYVSKDSVWLDIGRCIKAVATQTGDRERRRQ